MNLLLAILISLLELWKKNVQTNSFIAEMIGGSILVDLKGIFLLIPRESNTWILHQVHRWWIKDFKKTYKKRINRSNQIFTHSEATISLELQPHKKGHEASGRHGRNVGNFTVVFFRDTVDMFFILESNPFFMKIRVFEFTTFWPIKT